MTVLFNDAAQKNYGTPTSGDDTVCPVPAGVVDGDLMVLVFLAGRDGGGQINPTNPSGWTPFGGSLPHAVFDSLNFYVTTSLFWRVAASEPADYTVTTPTLGGSSIPRSNALIFAVSGAAAAAPTFSLAWHTHGDPNSNYDATATSITAAAGSLTAFVAHNWDLYGTQSPPSGMNERVRNGSSLIYLADEQTGAGATGDRTQIGVNAFVNEAWTALLLNFAPATFGAAINPMSGLRGQPLA